ncbi:MAG: molybdopterin-dependent oxidoreductase [Deltaproteobacteria bacterium]|nr:molybdopterin-dependent oxidoreductase [Deltaproteobacteria bacterium]
MTERPTRRALLRGTIAVAASAGLGTALLRSDGMRPKAGFLGAMERWNERFQRALFDPDRMSPELPERELTRDGAFPAYRISAEIPRAPAGWVLDVGGMVARPRAFSLEELMRMTRADTRVRHHCVEGWTAVAGWHGVRLRDLAEIVGADPRAGYVEFRSFDEGYWSSWDRESALHPQTILAYGRNGRLLDPAYGAPLRLYSAVKLGYKMVKYLVSVRFLGAKTGGYWEDQGYEWFAGV